MSRKRNRPWVEPLLWLLIVGGIIFVIIGFLFADNYEEFHDFRDKLLAVGATELGFAFLISAIIYVIFEERVKRDEAKGIAAFLYGIETESNYFKMIEDYIIRCPFYRKATKITYKFVRRQKESYLIDYTVEYTVINVSKVRQRFKVRGEVDIRPIYGDKEDIDDKLGIVEADVTRNSKISHPKLSFTDSKSSRHTKFFESEALVLKPRDSVQVKIQHWIQKHDHDVDVWQAVIPCSGVTLRLEWPTAWGLLFSHGAFHPNSDDLTSDEGGDETTRWKELTLDEPFMARHGLYFSWMSGPTPATATAAAAPEDRSLVSPERVPSPGGK